MKATAGTRKSRFGAYEVDLRAGELHKHGIRIKLQDQPFQILAVLLERPGEVVTREELRQKLWPADTFVDFDTGLNSAIKKLRDALADSAEEPLYIETLPRRGYRFIAHVENGELAAAAPIDEPLATVPPVWPRSEPSKKRRYMVAAGVAAFLMVAAFVTWRVLFSRPVLTGTDIILQTNFVNGTGDPVFDNSLDKALETKLTESPFLSVFPEASVRAALGMMRHNPNERVTKALGIEISKREGLKAVLVPEIAAFGSRYLITLDAIEVQNQKSIARSQEEAESKDKVIAALGKAASRLRKQLGESLSSLEKYDAPLDLATTSSLEALQAYRAGQVQFRSGKTRESIPYFERAVELDPQFCSAYAMLGHAYFSVGDEEVAKKNFAKAYSLKDGRATQEENFQITVFYHSYITGNLEKEIAILLLYQQAYPRSVVAANRLGIAYAMSGRKEDALQQFNWAIAHSPVPSAQYYSNAAQALMVLDRLDEAKKMLDEWAQKGSLAPFQREMRYRIAFFENDSTTMDRIAHEMPANDARWLELQLQLAFLKGNLHKVRSMSQDSVDQDRRAHQPEGAADDLALHAQLEAFAGDYALASKLCRQAKELNQDSASELWRCAEAFAYAGDLADAELLTTRLDKLFPEDTVQQKVFLPVMRSNIERVRGNPEKAVELLGSALQGTLDINYQLAQAYLDAREPDKAVAELKELLAHRGSGWWHIYAPLAQLGLARAYAVKGNRGESRKAYDDFFATWKDADPEIPILKQAQAEYARLQ
jgi:DNA-binding winged helix-turn-helix (wHTH) protein/tetratricopeptide (TPR) repeat protein